MGLYDIYIYVCLHVRVRVSVHISLHLGCVYALTLESQLASNPARMSITRILRAIG